MTNPLPKSIFAAQSVREVMPRLGAIFGVDPLFDQQWNPSDPAQQLNVMNRHIAAFNGSTASDVENLMARALTLREELLSRKGEEVWPWTLVFDLLHLNLAGSILGLTVQFGWLSRAAEWTRLPFVESCEYAPETTLKEVEVGPFLDLLDHPVTREIASYAIAAWAGHAYYYAWHWAAYSEMMGILFPTAMRATIEEYTRTGWLESLQSILMVLQWGRAYDRPEVMAATRRLEQIVLNGMPPEAAALVVSFFISDVRDDTERGKTYWIEAARSEHIWARLDNGGRLGVLGADATNEPQAVLDEPLMWQLVDRFSTNGRNVAGESRYEQLQQVDRAFSYVDPFALRLLRLGRIDDWVRLYRTWYGISDGNQVSGLVVVAPIAVRPIAASAGRTETFEEADVQVPLDELANALSASLGEFVNAGRESRLPDEVPERPGVPNAKFDDSLRLAVSTILRLDEPSMRELFERSTAQTIMMSLPLPTQALQLAKWGITRPISASLSEPFPERPIRSVAIYAGTSFETDMEVAMIRQIFTACGIHVEVFRPSDLDAFEHMYQDARHDVIWFVGHGERRAFAPERAALLLDEERLEMPVRRLADASIPGNAQRLFVINACELGAGVMSGRLPILGVASLISGPRQATISHRWVTRPLVARTFAAILASGLASGNRFFLAFSAALACLQKPKTALIKELRAIDEPLAASVEKQSVDFSALITSGSAIYQQ